MTEERRAARGAAASAAEIEIRALWDAGDHSGAAGLMIERYGREVLGFLVDRSGSLGDAEEIFSDVAESVVRGLPNFRWQASARSWIYAIARNLAFEHFRAPDRRRDRIARISDPAVERIAVTIRAATAPHLKTVIKDRFRELRRRLPEEDQAILVLRLDRGLSWDEIAAVMLNDVDGIAEPQLRAETTRLRQRFARAKTRLRELAEAEGLLK